MTYFYLYKITNKVNGKFYVGVHKAKSLDDGYMGSGKIIINAIEKYGINNFTKEILEEFSSSEEMFQREKEFITEDLLSDPLCYNLRRGGFGGFEYINKTGKNLYGLNGQPKFGGSNLKNGLQHKEKIIAEGRWEEHKNNLSKIGKLRYQNGAINPFKGKTHSEETKKKISEKAKIHQTGSRNSQFGKPRSQETKDKIRNSLLKRKIN
jgi:group I intron endonuclease